MSFSKNRESTPTSTLDARRRGHDSQNHSQSTQETKNTNMKIKWYGQACFWIESSDGLKIVTDPYTPATSGYRPIENAADVVIVSSDNDSFHCRSDLVPGQPTVINALKVAQSGGTYMAQGLTVHAIEAMEAFNHRFHDPDQNGMYKFVVDGITVGHMGDMGNAMSDAQTAFFAGIDVMLVVAGGHPTTELDDLKTFIDAAKPRYVIPMHFRTLRYKPRNILWIESFLRYFDDADVDFACDCEIHLRTEDLPNQTRILVLDNYS
jgi:L-ascorbate metabolism protein UlaG (beta-lactamase superfamily)